jgi:hypothetical protein
MLNPGVGGRKKAWGASRLLPHFPQGQDTAGLSSCAYLLFGKEADDD